MNKVPQMRSADDQQEAAQVLPPTKPDVVHVTHLEPQLGGSFTRNLKTGALLKAEHAQVDQPDQE